MKAERWLDVPGYDGLYSVSDWGRLRRNAARVWVRRSDHASHLKAYPTRILRPIASGGGYRVAQLFRNDDLRRVYLHRLVYEVFVGPIPDGMEINHIDAAPANNTLVNLEVVTRSGNMQHAAKLGRIGRGERHYRAQLSDAAAREAYERVVLRGERICRVARALGVQPQVVGSLTAGKTYRHLRLERVVFDTHGRPKPCGGVNA